MNGKIKKEKGKLKKTNNNISKKSLGLEILERLFRNFGLVNHIDVFLKGDLIPFPI